MLRDLLPNIVKGIPELNIQPFEPLIFNQIKIHRTSDEVINLNGSFSDIKVYGASNASIPQAYLNVEKKLLNFKLDIPKLVFLSNYNLNGNSL